VERKALDLVLNSAEYEEVPMEVEKETAAVEEQAVPGAEPEAPPPEEKAEEEAS
jgi:hypothetical protein